MTKPHADLINVGLLAAQRSTLELEFPLDGFERLADRLAGRGGSVRVQLRFIEAGDYPGLEGSLHATPVLECRRCLQAFVATVEAPVRVAVVTDDDAAARVPDDFEPVIAGAESLDAREFVEEELLLALPLVPMHASAGECAAERPEPEAAAPAAGAAPTQRPFGDLRSILKR